MIAVFAKKIGMTQVFRNETLIPVTILEIPKNVIVEKKSKTDVTILQVAVQSRKKISKPVKSRLEKLKIADNLTKFFEIGTDNSFKNGQTIGVNDFQSGEKITVQAITKGKGFAGTVKRWRFARGPMTHGSKNKRKPGSIGATYPEHVFRGKRMAGQMGNQKTSVKNLEIIDILDKENILLIKGGIPGPNKSLVLLTKK